MEKSRVLYLIHDFPPLSGGMSRYYHNLLGHLPPDEVMALISHTAGDKDFRFPVISANIPLNKNYSALSMYPRWFSLIKTIVKRYSPGILMACSLGFAKILFSFSTIHPRTRYGVFFHGLDILHELKKTKRNPLKKYRLKTLLKKSNIIVTNSKYTSGMIHRVVEPRNLVVVYPGVDIETFKPLKVPVQTLRRSLGLPSDGFFMIYVGRPVKRKGLGIILRAMKSLPDYVFLTVIGPGDFGYFIDLARRYGVLKRVYFEGYTDDTTLIKFYNASDVFVMPVIESTDDVEGFGIVYLEAMSTGLPVIGSSIGGVKEAINDGVTGFLLDPPSVDNLVLILKRLIDDPQLKHTMGTTGRQWVVENFQWKISANKFREAYLSL